MALGMRHWVAMLLLGAATITIWLLPPAGFGPGRRGGLETVQTRADAASADLRVAHGTLQRIRWADSLPALAVRTAQGKLAIGFPSHEDLQDEIRQAFHEYVRREVDALDRRDTRVTLGYFYQPFQHAGLPDLADLRRARDPKETYVGSYEGQPYCLQVRVVDGTDFVPTLTRSLASWEDLSRRDPDRSNFLAACRPYARFGLAGPKIQEWLENGAMRFASGSPRFFAQQGAAPWWMNRRRMSYWLTTQGYGGNRSLTIKKCMAGRADACLALITDPAHLSVNREDQRIIDRSPVTSLGSSSARSSFAGFDDYLFLDLEQEFGADAFQRFWTSEQEVPVAFKQAFGVGLGAWTVSWVQRLMGTVEAGPHLPGSAIWLSLLTVSFLAGLGGLWARRRQVA